jgi:hypothetical protein
MPGTEKARNDSALPLLVVAKALFVVVWAQIVVSLCRHWPVHGTLWLAIVFPTPWILMLQHRKNTGALMVGIFAYGVLAEAVTLIHL